MMGLTPLTAEQLELLSDDASNEAALTAKVEALNDMMKTRGWRIFSALMQQHELSAMADLMKPSLSGEQLIAARASLLAVNAMREWPVQSAQGIIDYLRQAATERLRAKASAAKYIVPTPAFDPI